MSILAAAGDEDLVDMVAVDPLARMYREILHFSGMAYPVRPQPGRGERLRTVFGAGTFDLVYASNALDHTQSPRACVEQMVEVLRPSGFLVLEGFVDEGSNGSWNGLHQHDLSPADDHLVNGGLPLTCVSSRVCEFRDRGIHAFGYELPPDLPEDAPGSWARRPWYAISFRRERNAPPGH